MPTQTGKPSLFNPQLLAKAMSETKDVKPVVFGERLPAGLKGAIAQLQSIELIPCPADDAKHGKTVPRPARFMAAGIVKSPLEFKDKNGNIIKTEGKRTMVGPIYLVQDHTFRTHQENGKAKQGTFERMTDCLKLLMGTESFAKLIVQGQEEDSLQRAIKALLIAKPHFTLNTREGQETSIVQENGMYYVATPMKGGGFKKISGAYPTEEALKEKNKYAGSEPMVFESWTGNCQWNGQAPVAAAAAQVDDASGAPTTPDEGTSSADDYAAMEEAAAAAALEQESASALGAPTDAPPSDEAEVNLLDAATLANNGDAACQKFLKDMAVELGVDPNDVDISGSWVDVVAMIEGIRSDNSKSATPAETSPAPTPKEKEEVDYRTGAVNPVNKKPLNPIKCIVTSVDMVNKTVNLRSIKDQKMHMKVEWSKVGY